MSAAKTVAKDFYRLLRWRFIPVRYAGKVRRSLTPGQVPPRTSGDVQLAELGYDAGPAMPAADVEQVRDIYGPRAAAVVPRPGVHPFANLFRAEDISADNPVFRYALSPAVLDRAHDYFGGRLRFDSLLVLHSWPTEGDLHESQMWHRDYGDSKSLHCIVYVNDVTGPEHGPFGFVDKVATRRIGASPFIRRISDTRFSQELRGAETHTFYGNAGEAIMVDPSACYHYGSRCRTPRLAVFVTFSTDRPYVAPQALLSADLDRTVAEARRVRPDLSETYLRKIFGG